MVRSKVKPYSPYSGCCNVACAVSLLMMLLLLLKINFAFHELNMRPLSSLLKSLSIRTHTRYHPPNGAHGSNAKIRFIAKSTRSVGVCTDRLPLMSRKSSVKITKKKGIKCIRDSLAAFEPNPKSRLQSAFLLLIFCSFRHHSFQYARQQQQQMNLNAKRYIYASNFSVHSRLLPTINCNVGSAFYISIFGCRPLFRMFIIVFCAPVATPTH